MRLHPDRRSPTPRFAGVLGCLLAALALLPAVPARAQNASTPATIELYPTFAAIGVRLTYTGDDNANATAHVEWRLSGATAWNTGVTLTRITNKRWAGSVVWLAEDTDYDVRVVVSDPDGGGGTVSGSARTRGTLPLTPTGTSYYVDTHGNDANSGSSASAARTHPSTPAKRGVGERRSG